MAAYLTTGCMLTCTMGTVPSPFVSLPQPGRVLHLGALPVGVITDTVPMLNISSFAMCNAPANPTVIAATTAAMGVPTPGACVPVPATPWAPASVNEFCNGVPKAMITSKCQCAYGGTIAPVAPTDPTRTGMP